MSNHSPLQSLSIDVRSAVSALLAMECSYCEQGFDGGDYFPSLATSRHLFCDACVEWDEDSIKSHFGGTINCDEMVECETLKALFEYLSTTAALRCISCDKLHPLDNCCRLRLNNGLERVYCVWCGVEKLGEDENAIVIPIEGGMIKELLQNESRDKLMSSLGEEGVQLLTPVVCCCLCGRRNGHQRKLLNGSRTSTVRALNCGHFVCNQQCLSEKINGGADKIVCCFCEIEIEDDGIRAEYLGDLLATASEGMKCNSCSDYRSTRDVCTVHRQKKCVWCLVASRKFVEKLIDVD